MKHFNLLSTLSISLLWMLFTPLIYAHTPAALHTNKNLLIVHSKTVAVQDSILPKNTSQIANSKRDSSKTEDLAEGNQNQPAADFEGVHFKLYPNPGNGLFHVEIDNIIPMELEFGVYDLTGKEIWQQKVRCQTGCKTTINLRRFNDGIYLLKIQSGNRQKVLKLLKQ